MTAVLAMTGLVFASGVPAQAAVSAPAAAVGAIVGHPAVTTAASGDLVIDLDLGDAYDPTNMEQVITQLRDESPHLSDAFKRMTEEASPNLSAGTAGAQDFSTTTDWPQFDGVLAMDNDHTGVSVIIPAAEVQDPKGPWQIFKEQAIAAVVGGVAMLLARAICIATLVRFRLLVVDGAVGVTGKSLCAGIGNFMGLFWRGFTLQAFDHTLKDPVQWAITLAEGLIGAVAPVVWEAGFNTFAEEVLPVWIENFGDWIVNTLVPAVSSMGVAVGRGLLAVGAFFRQLGPAVRDAVRNLSVPTSPSGPSCDIYTFYGTPCTAAYSMDRALFSGYGGPLYQVQRASDGTTADIGLLGPGGDVNAAEQDSFCANTSCTITKLYDQTFEWNDLTVAPGGGAAPNPDGPASATALPITIGGNKAYGLDIEPGMGYRNNITRGIAVNGEPEGMYMVASGTRANPECCFDFGNGEANSQDKGAGHMDAVNLSTRCWDYATCTGNGPWVQADLEDGLFMGSNNTNRANLGNNSDFVTALLKNNGQDTFALKGGDAKSGSLSTWYDGPLPGGNYTPMKQEGGIILGTGGDNSNWGIGSFFEGVMTAGYPSDAADSAVQAGIVAAGYAGDSAGAAGVDSAAGPAVAHDGYASVYTVDANGHLQETYDPAIGQPWITQDMSVKFLTPKVMAGTAPVAVAHDGYTSVYTVDAGGNGVTAGDLQETFLPALGAGWITQDMSQKYHTPPTDMTATAVYHDGYTSVYTVNRSDRHLWETFLPALGAGWTAQDLSGLTNGPPVLAGTSPVAVHHDGYTSVYTVNGGHHLEETFLPALGAGWSKQDLTGLTNGPDTTETPTAVFHSGYTSVYTVDQEDGSPLAGHLQETYLSAIGQKWVTQDLTGLTSGPPVAAGTSPVALFHTGYTSVYTVDKGSNHLEETFLPALGAGWSKQDMNTKFSTPPTDQTPIALLHADATGALTWTSVYTVNQGTDDLQESYLTAIGQQWVTKPLSTTPPADDPDSPPAAEAAVAHDGYTSVYTVDANGDLEEAYDPAIGQQWVAQDLSSKASTPKVKANTTPVAVAHEGYTSVYTIDAANGHLEETWLSALGESWVSQDLSVKASTPAANTTPAAVVHDGYTSVYTIDAANGHLEETWLSALGQSWVSQDLSAQAGTPPAQAGTSPAVVFHDGYTSVYTIGQNGDLQETWLPALGDSWTWQDLSAMYHVPGSHVTPSAVFHSGYVSVYTISAGDHLDETFLPAIGDAWATQDLSAIYSLPKTVTDIPPVALYHTGYTSVYTVDSDSGHLRETYLPAIGDSWTTVDMTSTYHTPVTGLTPVSALLHYDASGGLTWTSVFTSDLLSGALDETYLPALGSPWLTKVLP